MISVDQLLGALADTPLASHVDHIRQRMIARPVHGRFEDWKNALLSVKAPDRFDNRFDVPAVRTAGSVAQAQLEAFIPWRKGPFQLGDVAVDTEWRSDLKWDRIARACEWRNRQILDIGSGNGYYGYRMLGAGARKVIGVDPTMLFHMQWQLLARLSGCLDNLVLPIPGEDLPRDSAGFDIVLSMGVLYHRRDPIEHLALVRDMLAPGGTVLLETLIIEGDERQCLMPEDRYAAMRNVWFVPSLAMLERWLLRSRFVDFDVIDVAPTTIEEQRATKFMPFQSLRDFLDPGDPSRTIEGYPAPLRAVVRVRR